MVGRDIGTVVLPEADLKIFLVASVEERARRRHEEMLRRGDEIPYAEILESMKMRDQIDSTRDVSPLRPAEDAILIDSDRISVEQVVERVSHLMNGSSD
jgi:cytidylate kinase